MCHKPTYFESIRSQASKRWDQLENDPDLAGPWHQLFNQVQSPRHVISELLQNADDAHATCASVDIVDNEFIFRHDGDDFSEEHLTSLCRFGYSNKRTLHTIGFRGIGFKSTFSLGKDVVLLTPTLSIRFNKTRFTEPIWIERENVLDATEIRVKIENEHCIAELKKNFAEWVSSPTSLLFFRHLRSLRIEDQDVSWVASAIGPIENSEWMYLSTAPDKKYLLIKSDPEEFPADALEEIKEERRVTNSEETEFPPARVEIVLGLQGRLFVILPTGVKTTLPFACNAPFIQDPARVKIKSPEISPTNRWLLERSGKIASAAMRAWLNTTTESIESRCHAYSIFPDVDREDNSIEGSCGTIVELAFEEWIKEIPFLLDEDGNLQRWKGCVSVPPELLEIWDTNHISKFLCSDDKAILSRSVSDTNRKKLVRWSCVNELQKSEIIDTLKRRRLPKPGSWKQLLILWEYLSEEVTSYYPDHKGVRILPVRGKSNLYAAYEVIRFGERKLLRSNDDWKFLSRRILVLNQSWTRYLAKQRRLATECEDLRFAKQVEVAYSVLSSVKMAESSDTSKIIELVADYIFSQDDSNIKDYIRIAHIAAALKATASEKFKYVTRDGMLKAVDSAIHIDSYGNLNKFVSKEWCEEHVIHDEYFGNYTSCSKEEWEEWIKSARSKLNDFVSLDKRRDVYYNRNKFIELMKSLGLESVPSFPYKTDRYLIDGWDFDSKHWKYWENNYESDPSFWGKLGNQILEQDPRHWAKALNAKATQESRDWTERPVTSNTLLPSWIVKLRGLPCIEDTRGKMRQPAELLRRTPETEPLLEVEPFIKAEYDTEALRPLLARLGVRDTPTGSNRLIERIRNLSEMNNPPLFELVKWYQYVDQLVCRCDTDEFEEIKNLFKTEKLILTDDGKWASIEEVFLAADEESILGAAIVNSSFQNLSLWRRLGIKDHPTVDLTLEWLKQLPSGQIPSGDEIRRIKSLLSLYPIRIWKECKYWFNINNEWVPTEQLVYSLTMQTLIPRKHLFDSIKQITADLQVLPSEIYTQYPFSELDSLGDSIEERILEEPSVSQAPEKLPWLTAIGAELCRVNLNSEEDTLRIHNLADQLRESELLVISGLETIPYIDGTPVGTQRRITAFWKDRRLFVEDLSAPRMAMAVARELGRVFAQSEINDAIKLCYDRSPEFISEYMEENFELVPGVDVDQRVNNIKSEEKIAVGHNTIENGKATEVESSNRKTGEDGTPVSSENKGEVEEVIVGKDAGDEQDGIDSGNVRLPQRLQKSAKGMISFIERFAKAQGYFNDGKDRFIHEDGSWIARESVVQSFPWERRSSLGELLKCYCIKEHCLERGPLQLDADVWRLCYKYPNKYSLLLQDDDDEPLEVTGLRLMDMREKGKLLIYPAKYRLVYKSSDQ